MICPKCKSEYVEGIVTCPDCKVELIEESNVEKRDEFVKFVTLLKTSNSNLLAIAKSVLEDAEIEYFAFNENLQDIIGGGRLGGYNSITGKMELKVAEEDLPDANELLKELLEDI